jgi:NAD(P)-dependent dehydrogenase (short-subunit alcohol dehydrogenase family)
MPHTQDTSRRSFLKGAMTGLGTTAAMAAGTLSPADTAQAHAQSASRPFAGKVVAITGATSGIGRATAELFGAQGASVAFCGRREELGREVEAGIRKAGGEATYIRADVSDEAQVKAFIDATVARYGRLDGAFNNAGIDLPPARIADTDTAGFDRQIAINLRGVFLSMKQLPHLVRAKGTMVNMASIGGRHAFQNIVAYGASKAAVIHMTRSAAQEYGRDVRINALAPGAIETPMLARVREQWKVTNEDLASSYPIKRVGTAQEVAAAVLWLSGPAASYVSGQVLGVDGGDLP